MTATAVAHSPALDFFDDVSDIAPGRPQLRLIEGGGYRDLYPKASAKPVASVEVYRRRRFVALIAMTALVLSIAWAAGISVMSFGPTATVAASEAPAVHVVLPGDSYGAIAANLGVSNPALVAAQLQAANGGAELVVGQRLVVDVAALRAG